MIKVIYYRIQACIEDLRYFKDEDEFEEWFDRQNDIEPTIIISKEIE